MKTYEIISTDFKGNERIISSSEYLHSLLETYLLQYIDEEYTNTPTLELLEDEYFENVVEFKNLLNETLNSLLHDTFDFSIIKQKFADCGMNNNQYNKVEIRENFIKGWDE